MGWGNHHSGHKATYVCAVKGCNYHSRKFISCASKKSMDNHSHSDKCPLHQTILIYVSRSLPTTKTNKGRKKRKDIIKSIIKK